MALIEGIKIDGSLVRNALGGIGGLFRDIRTAITGKLDPEKEADLLQKVADAEQQIIMAQSSINLAEASNPNVFVSGWRPFIGWVCGGAMAFYYIPQALMATILWTIQCIMVMKAATDIMATVLPPYPIIFNMEEIIGLVVSLLGLAGYRTLERTRNIARN